MADTPDNNMPEMGTFHGGDWQPVEQNVEFDLSSPKVILTALYGDEEDHFVVALRNILSRLELDEHNTFVVYPGSSTHVGVARVFGAENVVHIEPTLDDCALLRSSGYLALQQGIQDYVPERQHDLVVALNSYGSDDISDELVTRLVKVGGYVIANNWTGWAEKLIDLESLQITQAMLPGYSSGSLEAVEVTNKQFRQDNLAPIYYKVAAGGSMVVSTEDDSDTRMGAYPDGLFVFQRS